MVPNGTLFGDGICARIKEELLKNFNLYAIIRLPEDVFDPYTKIAANILFFDHFGQTKKYVITKYRIQKGEKIILKPNLWDMKNLIAVFDLSPTTSPFIERHNSIIGFCDHPTYFNKCLCRPHGYWAVEEHKI